MRPGPYPNNAADCLRGTTLRKRHCVCVLNDRTARGYRALVVHGDELLPGFEMAAPSGGGIHRPVAWRPDRRSICTEVRVPDLPVPLVSVQLGDVLAPWSALRGDALSDRRGGRRRADTGNGPVRARLSVP